MHKNILHFILLTIFLALISIPISQSISIYIQQKEYNQITIQQLLQAEKTQQINQEKIYLLGKFDPAQNSNFTLVPQQYNIVGHPIYLRKETLAAFIAMAQAAAKDNIKIVLASATRNFDYQKNLWDDKWEGITLVDGGKLPETIPDGLARFKEILEYSAVPGTSRHHWGTDIDINGADPAYFNTPTGEAVYNWMTQNAATYGFCQTYTPKGPDRPTGYDEEKWHWSYLPLSRNFTKEYAQVINQSDISGFDGDQYVPDFNLINDYVLDINPACR